MLKRVTQAFATGATPLASGASVAVFDPPVVPDLPDVDPDRCDVISFSAQMHAACKARGVSARRDPGGPYDAALVFLGRSRAFARVRLAQAAALVGPNGIVLVDGQKTDGVEPALKDCAAKVDIIDSYVKSHGRLFWFRPTADFSDWATIPDDWPLVDGFRTGPGVFSADGIDPGSAMLADHFPPVLKGRGADLGAGWGFLSARLLAASTGITALHLIEDDDRALASARHNVTDPRAVFDWADATTWRPEQPLDFVITNPPFHAGRGAEPDIGRAFIASAAAMLARHGRLILVANRHLPYEAALDAAFAEVTQATAQSGYKVIVATGPRAKSGSHSATGARRRR